MTFSEEYKKMCDCEEVQCCGFGPCKIPNQSEVQNWIFQYGSCQYKLLSDMYEWATENRPCMKGRSMEEMWLMFYMWRDHSKVWDGQKWVKE